jgi:flagellar basal body rod protein FlgB
MIDTPVYKGTEIKFGELMSHLKSSKIEVMLLQSKSSHIPEEDVRSEDVYLIDSVAMKVTIVAAQSAMAVNDDVYVSLVGNEKTKVGDIEKIVRLYFN